MKRVLITILLLTFFVVTACTAPLPAAATPTVIADMANPASVHCADLGYELEIRDEEGGQVGYCIFPDGSECEEWAFLRDECAPGETESK